MPCKFMFTFLFAAVAALNQTAFAEGGQREFRSDRPGSTVTAGTIDAGDVQLETQILSYASHQVNGEKTTQVTYPTPTLRLGLTKSSEVQVTVTPYVQSELRVTGAPVERSSGMGDTVLAYKYNLRGNEGESFGWALMPAVKAPTNTGGMGNNKWEPSLAVPLGWSSESGWSFSVLPEVSLRKNSSDRGMHTEYNYPLNIGHNIAGPVDGFADFVVHTSSDRTIPTTSYFGGGVSVKAGENAQYDIGCNFGLNADTPDFGLFVGFAFRP